MKERCYCGAPDCPSCGRGEARCEACREKMEDCNGHVTEAESLSETPEAQGWEKWAHMSERSNSALLEVANAIQRVKEAVDKKLRLLAEGEVKAAEYKFLEARRQDWDMWREMNVVEEKSR